MTSLEAEGQAGRDTPVGRAVAQPAAHRTEDLQRLGHTIVGADTDLERIRLAWRNGRGAVEKREYRERLGDQVGCAHTPAERVVEFRASRRADERVGERDVTDESREQRLAQIHTDGLVELAGAEPAARVGRRELDFEVRGDLGQDRLLLEQDVLPLEKHITKSLLSGCHLVLRGRSELALFVLAYAHAAAGDHDGLARLVDVGDGEAQGEAVYRLHPERKRHVDERRILTRAVITDRGVDGSGQRPERLVLLRRCG